MNEILSELERVAIRFNSNGIIPVICGGLGVYLLLKDSKQQERNQLRATHDIDLMLTHKQIIEQSKALLIADVIQEMGFIARDDAKYVKFVNQSGQVLDILSPDIEGFEKRNFRLKIIKSRLHSHFTKEAEFIEDNLREINLADFDGQAKVYVPSPTNLLILKLFAFCDRILCNDIERALAHCLDIFLITVLSSRDDYLKGQEFLKQHSDSEIIKGVCEIVNTDFINDTSRGWQVLLGASSFFEQENISQKRDRITLASKKLIRWFRI